MATERSGVFGITSAPPREKPRVLSPDVKPIPKFPPPEQPPKTKKPLLQRLIGNFGVRIGLGVLAVGSAGYAAHKTNPDIFSNIPGISRPAETPAETATPFGNTADEETLNASKAVFITDLSELQNTPTPFPESTPLHEINILYPIIGLPESGSVKIEKDLAGKNSAAPLFSEDTRQDAIENNLRNILRIPILKDQEVILPVDPAIKEIKLTVSRPMDRPLSEGVFNAVKISYIDPRNGRYYQISIAEDISTPFTSLIKGVPKLRLIGNGEGIESIEKTVRIENGQPLKILRSLQNGTLNMFAMAKPSESAPGSQFYPVNLNLIATKDTTANRTGIAVVVEK